MSTYLTLARDASAEIEVKRSRFLCDVARVSTEDEARAVVERARKQHWEARHHCSAFVLGPDGSVQRSNDDGEPSGTAGAPMLEVLRGRGVSDTVAVVTRWFGGTLLGAGGLVRAYSDAVRAALDEAGLLERRLLQRFDVTVSHADAGKVENDLRARGVTVLGVDYAAQATLHLAVADTAADRLPALLAEVTGGGVAAAPAGSEWVDGPGTGSARPEP
ncbi:MAG TPA: YigZ family protein [Nocardioidaceae bacterium]|nr:YigZ family protein [Nocardioidaceae bacterium]